MYSSVGRWRFFGGDFLPSASWRGCVLGCIGLYVCYIVIWYIVRQTITLNFRNPWTRQTREKRKHWLPVWQTDRQAGRQADRQTNCDDSSDVLRCALALKGNLVFTKINEIFLNIFLTVTFLFKGKGKLWPSYRIETSEQTQFLITENRI